MRYGLASVFISKSVDQPLFKGLRKIRLVSAPLESSHGGVHTSVTSVFLSKAVESFDHCEEQGEAVPEIEIYPARWIRGGVSAISAVHRLSSA